MNLKHFYLPTTLALSLIVGIGACTGNHLPSKRAPADTNSAPATHAPDGNIYCTAKGQDPDGDGWGWENNGSCLVRNSAADPAKGEFNGCLIGTVSWNFCATDNGGWGYEKGEVCIAQSFCPANRTTQQTARPEKLVDPKASATAQQVYSYLGSIWGKSMLAGQQDLTWNDSIDMFDRVVSDTGKAPAVMGYDLMNYGYPTYPGQSQTEEAITHWERGGLVTFCWHWRDPRPNQSEFYSDKTDFEIPILNGQLDFNSPAFKFMQNDIDRIAAELKKLQDAGVIVLWRPLHEAAGGWFWWGRARNDGIPAAYAQTILWKHLYDRLVNEHGLHNLIWVWNGQSAAWYPGDNYVDVVSQDIYEGEKNYQSHIKIYTALKNYPLQTKLVALTETSNIPDPDQVAAEGAWWLWFLVWNDGDSAAGVTSSSNFWTGEYFNTQAHKMKVYHHKKVITLDELPDFEK